MTLNAYRLVGKEARTMIGDPVCHMLACSRIKSCLVVRTAAACDQNNYQSCYCLVCYEFSYLGHTVHLFMVLEAGKTTATAFTITCHRSTELNFSIARYQHKSSQCLFRSKGMLSHAGHDKFRLCVSGNFNAVSSGAGNKKRADVPSLRLVLEKTKLYFLL
jgi:hypothetical protein